MKNFFSMLGDGIDFNFVLAIIAILGTAGFLHLQLSTANTEFETLNASMHSAIRNQSVDEREDSVLNDQLNQLEKELNSLNLN